MRNSQRNSSINSRRNSWRNPGEVSSVILRKNIGGILKGHLVEFLDTLPKNSDELLELLPEDLLVIFPEKLLRILGESH